MKKEVTIDGKAYQIEISDCPVGEPFKVSVNNKQREITLEQAPENAKSFTIRVDRIAYQIELSEDRSSLASVKVNNIPFKVEFKVPTASDTAATAQSQVSVLASRPSRTVVEGAVVAPMTGKIVTIRVKKGDNVKAGTVLCTLEAMKMENEIASPKAGAVEEIRVQEGKGVNEGDILMILK